jgi:hypothetical protein
MRLRSASVVCLVFGCEGSTDVLQPSAVEIEFTASALEVEPCRTVALAWSAPGADIVNVEAGPVTLISSIDPEGSIESPPICETTTFVLTARDGTGTRTASLTVRASWGAPEIVAFRSEPASASTGYEIWLHWTVANAARASLTSGGQELVAHEASVEDVVEGTDWVVSSLEIDLLTTTTFVLIASNPDASVSEELSIEALPLAVHRFSMSPPASFGSTQVIFTWAAEGERTELRLNGVPVDGFPGTLAGSYEMELAPSTNVDFNAVQIDPRGPTYASASGVFAMPVEEQEPNDDVDSGSLLLPYAGAGQLSSPDDVDFFRVHAGSPLRIWTTPRTGTSCTLYPTLVLYDVDGTELGRVSERPTAPGICALIDAELHPFAADVGVAYGSQYRIAVGGDGVETGDYLLFVEANLIPF